MNKAQLETILDICETISDLINSDVQGLSGYQNQFFDFRELTERTLKDAVWQNYKYTRNKDKQTPKEVA